MSPIIFILVMLLILIVCIIILRVYIYLDIKEENRVYFTHKKNIKQDDIVKHLNTKWNIDPYKYIDDPQGGEKSLVFIHYFVINTNSENEKTYENINKDKCDSDSNVYWCPKQYSIFDQYINKNLNTSLIKTPIKSVSFMAGNKNLNSFTYNIPYFVNNYGMIFDFTYENKNKVNIRPLCFYNTDAKTDHRSKMGCGNYGELPLFDYENNYLHELNDENILVAYKLEIERISNLKNKNLIDKTLKTLYNVFKRKSLNFQQFIKLNKMIYENVDYKDLSKDDDLGLNNEVILNQWNNKKIEETPIVALFYNSKASEEEIKMIKNIKYKLFKFTGNIIPIIKFNENDNDTPFSTI